MKVSFKMPTLYKGVDPNAVYEEIRSIGENVTPEQIVESAKDENTELHKCFEWDDTIAAAMYRKEQAKMLVRCLVIEEKQGSASPVPIRAMYTSKDGGYKETKMILQDKDEYAALLERAQNELRAFKQKYSMLKELDEIFRLIK